MLFDILILLEMTPLSAPSVCRVHPDGRGSGALASAGHSLGHQGHWPRAGPPTSRSPSNNKLIISSLQNTVRDH